jgi:outer membrane lipoprotein carrier protein
MRRRFGARLVAVTLAWALLAFPGQHRGTAHAGAPVEEVVERVQETCLRTRDLSARFQQTATNRALGQVQEASGTFLAKRPGKMRWEYQTPDARLYVTDGKTLWAYSESEKQVVVQDVADAVASRLPLAFLAGNCALAKDFEVALIEHAGTRGSPPTRILDLKPKRPEAGIARMLLEVNTKGYTVEKTTLFDAYGNTTAIALSRLKLNSGLDDQQFRFVPPAGVTVVTPGKP